MSGTVVHRLFVLVNPTCGCTHPGWAFSLRYGYMRAVLFGPQALCERPDVCSAVCSWVAVYVCCTRPVCCAPVAHVVSW